MNYPGCSEFSYQFSQSFQPHKALEVTQTLTEMITRDLPEGKTRPAHKADFSTICEATF
jgi:hypothetical protein